MNRKIRFLSGIMAFTVAVSITPCVFSEDEIKVSMKGIFHQYNTIKGVAEGNVPENAEYSWLYSESENGEYTEIPESEYVTDNEITLVQGTETIVDNVLSERTDDFYLTGDQAGSLSGKWIKYRVSVNGVDYDSEPARVDDRWITLNTVFGASDFSEINAVTPNENVFEVDGQKFILLDTTLSDTAHFLVMAKEIYGITSKGIGQQLEELAHYLDNDFKENGLDGKKLPDAILDSIDYNVYWKVGRPYWPNAMGFENRYIPAVKTGIFVPSKEEVLKYSSKIGLQDENIDWMLRDPASGSSADGNMLLYIHGQSNMLGSAGMFNMDTQTKGIRPVFHLSEDFFEKNPVSFKSTGMNIRKLLLEKYSIDELVSFGYKRNEVESSVNGEISEIWVDGTFKVREILQGAYTGTDVDEAYALMQWKYSDNAEGEYIAVQGATETTFVPDVSLADKWIKFTITLGSGKYYESEPIFIESIWDDAFEGEISDVELKGIYEPYQKIKVSYAFDDITTESDVVYKKWYVSDEPGGSYTEITGTDGHDTFVVIADYADKWIKSEITLKNKNKYSTQPKQIGSVWNYTLNQIDNSVSNKFDVVNKTTPSEYVFKVDGQEFILLDSTESDSSRFLVMAKDTYGSRQFYTVDMQQKYDQMNEWLNTEFRANGNGGKKLPDKLLKYIDYEQTWQTEAGRIATTAGHSGGIAIPSITEIKKYSEKIGLADSGEDWWARTPVSFDVMDGNSIFVILTSEENVGKTAGIHGTWSSKAIRPMFYISKDYFLENILDMETTGSEVFRTLGKSYTKDELRGLYDIKVLEDVFGFEPDYTFECLPFTDMDGEIVECLCLVTNHIEDRTGTVMICIYDADNRLVGIDMQTAEFKNETETEIVFSIENLPATPNKTIEAYLIDKSELLSPITYKGIVLY